MMRLVHYGDVGHEKAGLIDAGGHLRDLSEHLPKITGDVLSDKNLENLGRINLTDLPMVPEGVRLGAPIAGVGKVVGVALNYRRHIVETGAKPPTEPILFLKATSAICGPTDPIILPPQSQKLDWEVELGIVIGTRAQNIKAQDAMRHIAGYCILNDVSERAFQLERGGQQHTKGKSADSFCPLGPWLVTRDEVADPQNLRLITRVNGAVMQDGNTRDMIYPVAELVSYISEFMTLLPGDIIATGTPDGVGHGRTPPVYLRAGDVVEMRIDGLGEQKHTILSNN